MNARLRAAALVLLGAALAASAIFVWQHYLSPQSEIKAVHAACLKEVADTKAKLKSSIDVGRTAQPDNLADALSRSASDVLGKWLDGMASGVSEAVCGTILDACKSDFDGRVCVAARERYR
ncbi:MAG TPA: hypothetical protein VNG69_01075 [Casimicrobiaceae bacterium]|nr:hypothetical protein [Casimicrobiaceae bacterium]